MAINQDGRQHYRTLEKINTVKFNIMALLRSTVNPQHYLKVLDNCAIFARERQIIKNKNIDGVPQPDTVIPASVDFVIGYRKFKSREERLAADTDEMIWFKDDTITYHILPELPPEWQPKNADEQYAERIKSKAYIAIQSDPAFSEWVSDEQ